MVQFTMSPTEIKLLQEHLTPSLQRKINDHIKDDGTFTLYPSAAHKVEKIIADNHIQLKAVNIEKGLEIKVVEEATKSDWIKTQLFIALLVLMSIALVFSFCFR